MDQKPPIESPDATKVAAPVPALPAGAPGVLDYRRPGAGAGRMARVRSYATAAEAQMAADRLAGEGVRSLVLNQLTNALGAPYSGWSAVEVHVAAEDLAVASALLATATESDDVEPADDPPGGLAPVTGADGVEILVAHVATYDRPRALHDAQMVLAAVGIETFLPRLVPRGDRPAGEGKWFVLRVRDEDLERARSLLDDADAEARDDDEPRCPKCGSWQVHPVSHFGAILRALLALRRPPPETRQPQHQCLRCTHRWPAKERVQ